MIKMLWNVTAVICLCGIFIGKTSTDIKAAANINSRVGVETSSSYMVKIDAPLANLYEEMDTSSPVVGSVPYGRTYDVLSYADGWVKVDTGSEAGYLRISSQATVVETAREKVDETELLRDQVVKYALQFVGNSYEYGGSDPYTGVDCSGFTSYVMRYAAGVRLSHSSAAQAGQGKSVGSGNPKPGDLVFYSDGSRINHVAIYMGQGKIVHASSAKTGIKISDWNYREPVKVIDVLSGF